MATSIRLSPEVEQRLDFLAAKTGRSKGPSSAGADQVRRGNYRESRGLLARRRLEVAELTGLYD
ncbi:hypothetical protein [Mesorhizobium sp.]|uniref:hypothetical protein n=1 Tax=Mesorhizobium sp. TaxID=1871066 RepID=UPI00257C0609|nr:hypothetical protein [Mesorhizobium sp.]